MARTYGSRDMRERTYQSPTPVKASRGLVRLSPLVPPEIHATAFSNAQAMGVSMGKYVAELIRRDQVDENGVPLWAPELRNAEDGPQESLPLPEQS
ncbi:hypothetical protein ACJBCE_36955 [Streptomyces sp. NBUL23]|uniref:hypothetical protein n=1 Tax=Streptomyces sp. NBUL23 TaxID=3381354 RepID=UPI0038715893